MAALRWCGVSLVGFTLCLKASAAPPTAAAPPATPVARTTAPATASLERSRERKAVVEIRIQNRTVALGFVLDGDGRILSTLSTLGRGVGIVARYADGSTAKLRIIHTDRQWDLALLCPDDQRFTTGLLAAKDEVLNSGTPLRLLRLEARSALREVALTAPHQENLTGGDAALLAHAVTFTQPFTAADLGAPIIDANGAVVAMVAQACLPKVLDHCSGIYYAAPTVELKRFIREGITAQNAPLPWLGLTVSQESGSIVATRIQAILPNSPASTLGLHAGRTGDLLLAVNGTAVGSPKDLAELLHRCRAGDRVTLLLLVEGRYQEVRVTLSRYPEADRPSTGSGLGQPDLGY